MNEACLNAKWLGKDLTQVEAQEFTKDVLNHMRERLSDYQEQYGDLYNLEATPAESTTYRFAKHDKETFPNIITANENGTPYYTNSSHLPVGYTEDIFSALDIQDELQTLYTSGTVFHAFLGEKLPIRFARIMAILQVKCMNALAATRKLKCIAVLQDIIVLSRIGMMARRKNSKIVKCMR